MEILWNTLLVRRYLHTHTPPHINILIFWQPDLSYHHRAEWVAESMVKWHTTFMSVTQFDRRHKSMQCFHNRGHISIDTEHSAHPGVLLDHEMDMDGRVRTLSFSRPISTCYTTWAFILLKMVFYDHSSLVKGAFHECATMYTLYRATIWSWPVTHPCC